MSANRFDVLVIGGGIAGASVAAHLAPFVRVAVIEREEHAGYHSTGRSAALFSEIYGNAPVRALSRASREFLFAPPADFAEFPLATPRGALHIAREDQIDRLDDFLTEPDVAANARRVTAADAEELCPILRKELVVAGAYEPNARDIDVHALHQGYLRLLKKDGGEAIFEASLESMEKSGGGWRIQTTQGEFEASVVVNAAGAWADEVARLAGAKPLGITPCRRTALLVDSPEGIDLKDMPLVIDMDEEFYFKPDAGKLLLSPADETPSPPCDAQPDELDIAIAVDRVEAATTLKVTRVARKWAGLRSFAPDRCPVIGFDTAVEGFFWLAGQGGYGIQTAPAASKLAASLLLNKPVPGEIAKFGVTAEMVSPKRFAGA